MRGRDRHEGTSTGMLSEWSAECGADDPVLVVPWSSPDGELEWVDLREDPYALDDIHEANDHPALMAALRALNGPRSPVFTAKCDVWTMDSDELEAARMELMVEDAVATAGMVSYIDMVWRERTIFASRPRMEQMLYRLDRMAVELSYSLAQVEYILRPAVVELEGAVGEGFAVTLYVKAVGVDEAEAAERWDEALRAVTALLRAKELLGR
ncbi:hypothetical protein SAMN05443244_1787 [Terriglobus roseus]|uniref:Uncharacterized protein n=2 Tax=Terriglobus roseus TaxID=392734 RepID=A0A1H4M334_9BACT|nr:hypothetical protein SAMN05443244_1787 [Terriglobus roseus]